MIKIAALFLVLCFTCSYVYGQSSIPISIPTFNDEYTTYVRALESGNTDIDYQKFRESFIESKQFIVSSKQSGDFEKLKKQMYLQIEKSQYQDVINTTKKMLSINYTNMLAHKILRQTYKIVGDTANAAKYKSIQFGLLKSIVEKGDGKTCATAWPVTQVDEEYFILDMIGARVTKQSVDTSGPCDKLEVETKEGNKQIYYFEIAKSLRALKN
ncbi:DUF4919 domain-containing protein [Hymenobacter tenuis]